MNATEYKHFRAMYNGLKTMNTNAKKLPTGIRRAVSFALLMATREALAEWDKENCTAETFTDVLAVILAESLYTVLDIITKKESE